MKRETVNPEVLPAEMWDSENSRLTASKATQFYVMATTGCGMMVAGSLACGFLLLQTKRTLPHGSFMKWQKQYLCAIPDRTQRLYLRYAHMIELRGKGKLATIANLLSIDPQEVTQDYIKRVAPKVREITSGKTFAEIGRELGIVKERDTPSRKADRKHAKDTGHKPTDYARYAAEWADELERLAPQAEQFENYIKDEDFNRVVTAMRQICVGLQIPFEILAEVGG